MKLPSPADDARWWLAIVAIALLGIAVDAATGNWGGSLGTPGDVVMVVGIFLLSFGWPRLRPYLPGGTGEETRADDHET